MAYQKRLLVFSVALMLTSYAQQCVEDLGEQSIISDFKLSCPVGQVITGIDFGSFGNPSGSCASGFTSRACALVAGQNIQAKVDQNVLWVVDNLCVGQSGCDFKNSFGNDSSLSIYQVFGDPCPHIPKGLSVKVSCGAPVSYPRTSTSTNWSDKQDLNFANFKSTNRLIDSLYKISGGMTPYDLLDSQDFKNLELNFDPRYDPSTPYQFVPLWVIPLLAFRGTLNTADWIADANIHSTALPSFLQPSSSDIPASKILIHSGFANLYTGLRNILIAGVKGYKPKGIIITGHSLGSALATLAAYDLANQGFPVHSVYLYASPRVGNPYFAHAFDIALKKVSAKVYRISNTADIVTSIPPSALSLAGSDAPSSKYSHVGNSDCTFEYVAEDDYVLALSFGDYLKWAHSLDTYLKAFPPFSGMAQA